MSRFSLNLLLALAVVSPIPLYSQTNCSPPDMVGKASFPMNEESMKERFPEIRESLPTLEEYTDSEITMIMRSMGASYYWMHDISATDKKVGVLILAHGDSDTGDQRLYNNMGALAQDYPTIIAYGMSMMTSSHISCALQEFQDKGIGTTFVVPLSESPDNTLIRQWRYVFGLEEHYAYADVSQIIADNIKLLEPINDDHYAREIVYDHAMQISTDPADELVILIAHGPIDPTDNLDQLKSMANISQHVQQKGRFYEVIPFTLQDDASPNVRAKNVKRLRETVEMSMSEGRQVLVVTNLMSTGIIQAKVERDLEGLSYIFNGKGLVEHPYFVEWIKHQVKDDETMEY